MSQRPLPRAPAPQRSLEASRPRERSGSFIESFIGEPRVHSCAIFSSPDSSLAEAQRNKLRVVAEKLDPRGKRILEIGAGWGELAALLATEYGADVTCLEPNARRAEQVTAAFGHIPQLRVAVSDWQSFQDHRRYDVTACVGSFESVSQNDYPAFFHRCSTWVKPSGLLFLHTTVASRSGLFRVGTQTGIVEVAASAGFDLERGSDYTSHYVRTIDHWEERILERADALSASFGADEVDRQLRWYGKCRGYFASGLNRLVHLSLRRSA